RSASDPAALQMGSQKNHAEDVVGRRPHRTRGRGGRRMRPRKSADSMPDLPPSADRGIAATAKSPATVRADETCWGRHPSSSMESPTMQDKHTAVFGIFPD